jgi:uncharacterized repeat protein (TIGR01451 family)
MKRFGEVFFMRWISSDLKVACVAGLLVASLAGEGFAASASLDTTTTTITSMVPPGPITLGSSATVSVTVAGNSGTPTGSVTVSDGTGASCPITLAGGSGSCDLTPSSAGTKSVTAQYVGDANFMGSTSAASSLIVTPPARTITSSGDANGSISPSSQYVTDGNTAAFNVTANNGYTVIISGTCPAGTLSHNVYTTGSITGDCAVSASFVSAESALSLQVTDDHAFARYGASIDYTVTVSNSVGVDVLGLTISAAASADLDTGSSQWMCFGSNTQCQQQGQGAFLDNAVTIPGKGSVSWLVTVPVLPGAPDVTADYTINLNGPPFAAPIMQTDSDTAVIFHDSFDVPYGDGAQ